MQYLYIYFVVMGLIGFIQMGLDKRKAKKHQWRIPEMTLFLTAIIGASFGSFIGMYVFRHKTKHQAFVYGMPFICVLHIVLLFVLNTYFS